MKTYLGIDVGTSGVKAVLLSETGEVLCRSKKSCQLAGPEHNWAEQDPESWWASVCETVKTILAEPAVSALRRAGECICGIAVSGAGGTIPVDAEGKPLCNAIMQMDKRALAQLDRIAETLAENDYAVNLNSVKDGVCSAHFLKYLQEEKPRLYHHTDKFLMSNSFITYKLTGVKAAGLSRYSTTMMLDQCNCSWSDRIAEKLGLSLDKMPAVCEDTDVIGYVTKAAAKETGLTAGIPVAAGAMDTVAACLGCGIIPGKSLPKACGVLGTFGKLCVIANLEKCNPNFTNVIYCDRAACMSFIPTDGGAGLSIDWLKQLGGKVYDELNLGAANVAPGCDGLFYLPWLTGSRVEGASKNAGAAFLGIKKEHQIRHLYRAVLEGVAFSFKAALNKVDFGDKVEEIAFCGGGCNSTLWMRIMADVLEKPVRIIPEKDTEAVGAAMIAAYSQKKQWVTPEFSDNADLIFPDTENAVLYQKIYEDFLKEYNNRIQFYSQKEA